MWKHLGLEAGRRLEPRGDVARDGEEARGLAERDAVEVLHLPTQRALLRRVAELPERRPVQLVRLAELVDEPHALLGVAHEIGRELRRHHHVDSPAVRLVEVEQPPQERLREDARAGIPLERNGDEICLVIPGAELLDELIREDLDAPVRERHLRPADGDSHGQVRIRRATNVAPW